MPVNQTSGNLTTDAFGGGAAAAAAVKYIENYFQTWLRTGTGASATITTGLDASTNKALVWTKSRSAATDHKLTDTVRGATKALISDTTGAQTTDTNGLTAFSSTGYTIGTDTNYNNSGATYVDWEFVATPKFFDVVTYTGDGNAGRTVAHNLGSTPGCMIVKQTSAAGQSWAVYHKDLGATKVIWLDLTSAAQTRSFSWNNTAPTSTVFTVGAGGETNSSGETYVAYLFADNAGGFGLTGTDNVISCGSYTGTGANPGPTINLGFEPQWVLVKNATTAFNWSLYDTMRGMPVSDVNTGNTKFLRPNTSDAEVGGGTISPTATGFQLNTTYQGANFSGDNYIYIAIRRGPMKVPTDATKVFAPTATSATTGTKITTGFVTDLQMANYRSGAGSNTVFTDRLRGISNTSAASPTVGSANTNAEISTIDYLYAADNTGWLQGSFSSGGNSIRYDFRRAPSFFDEVCYTGTGSQQNITHNLGVAPELLIVKRRSAAGGSWATWVTTLTADQSLALNTTDDKNAVFSVGFWGSTYPTTSVFTVGSNVNTNSNTVTYVAYLFATCAGVSKVGSYTGNGTTQTINCGFTGGARFVLIKRTDSTGDWYVYDTARGMTTLTDPYLLLNSTAAETATLGSVTTVSTGFALNAAILAAINTSSATYIFLAIA